MSSIPETYAAVDLGSNSFHMIVANITDNRIQLVDKIKEPVRLAGGLDESLNLTQDAMDRALACLERFGQRLKTIPRVNVRAVGTNTLRQARNGTKFMFMAKRALGHSIEIISGREEARLIFLGVAHSIYNENDKRLVVDIGGGSTEVVIGKGYQAHYTESLYMGCVSMSHEFFVNGEINTKKMRKAILAARQELETVEAIYKKVGWDSAIGSSGTIIRIEEVIREKGWSDTSITLDALKKLKKELTSIDHIDQFNSTVLTSARRPVFPGGVAILYAIFEALGLEMMEVSDGALREGLLYDLIGRLQDEDTRDKTVVELSNRYGIDMDHAKQVEQTAIFCFNQLASSLNLDEKNDLKILRWAATLHEIGLTVAHSQYHKHGAYLLNNSDLPGFSHQEQNMLSMLVRGHRRKIPPEIITLSKENSDNNYMILIIILRLAILLNRGRSFTVLPEFTLSCENHVIKISFPENWLSDHPLTEADLGTEADYLTETAFKLKYE